MIYIYNLDIEMNSGAKRAVQDRSRQTRDRIISALDTLLQKREFDAISIVDIAAQAGVSAASIYQRFENKGAAISILIELYIQRVEEWGRTSQNAPDTSKATSLREALIMIGISAWHQFDELNYVMRPAYLHSRLHPDLLSKRWDTQEKHALKGFQTMLEAWPDDISHRNTKQAAGMVTYFFNMMFLGRLLHPEGLSSWHIPAKPKAFANELADFVCGYLAMQGNKKSS